MDFRVNDSLFVLLLFLLLLIAVFLITSEKGKRISNVLIGAFFLAVFLNLADSFLLLKQVYFSAPAWALWGSGLLLLCGPLMMMYTQSVIYRDFHITYPKLRHFIPFLVVFLSSEISYLAAGRNQQLKILRGILDRNIPSAVYLVSACIYLHFLIYLFISLRLIKTFRAAAANRYSNEQKVTMDWLQYSIWFFLILMGMGAANSYFSFQSWQQPYFVVFGITVFLLLLFVVFVLFKALRNPGLFSVWNQQEIEEAVQVSGNPSSVLADEEKNLLTEKLLLHMQSARPFLQPELTLDELAGQLAVKPKILSMVINEQLQKNFFEFINQYRIEEAKRLLTRPKDKKITVLEVMYEVGFNSKSSFNTLFKKFTGITPSEFKKQNSQ